MPCNLAVTITKLALDNKQLMALVDGNADQVLQMVASYIQKRHQELRVAPVSGNSKSVQAGRCTVTLDKGRVTVTASGDSVLPEVLSKQVTPFLALIADQLFTKEVERVLTPNTTITDVQTSEVTNAGVLQRATVFTCRKNGLTVRVFVLPGARLQIFVDTGTFVQAKAVTEQLLQNIQAQGLTFSTIGDVEQHRDDVDHVHVHHVLKGQH